MSKETYERRQIGVESSTANRTENWVWLLVAIAALAIPIGSYLSGKARQASTVAKQAAYDAAVSQTTPQIELAFKEWSAVTSERDVAIKWSGAESEVLYIRYIPTPQSRGVLTEGQWDVFARTKSGKIFVVECWLNDDLKLVVGKGLKQSSPEALLRVLLIDKRTDLIEKLKFPVKPA